jgi:large subunit ribosomal protein L25
MEFTPLSINKRKNTGKGAARRMRRGGSVPAVIYGGGVEALSVSVEPRAIQQALAGPMRLNTVLALKIAGDEAAKEIHAIVRDHQYHPVRRTLQHVDFLAIDVTKPLRVHVPLIRTGARCPGEQEGGVVTQVFRDLPVECLPDRIPVNIELDLQALELGGHVTVGEIKLPEGVKVALAAQQSVFTVAMPKAEKVQAATTEGAEGEAAATVEGAEGAKEDAEKKE